MKDEIEIKVLKEFGLERSGPSMGEEDTDSKD